jgi:plasmid stabilization system protein ParE
MRFRYDEDAREDLRSAVSWYEQHRAGLGARFHVSVKATERLIATAPRFHPKTDLVGDAAIRRALIPEFPYALLYMEHGGELWILAVMHLHRRPGYWLKRARRVSAESR